jgi:SP family sugar:H+ symporter-like MFS transporter
LSGGAWLRSDLTLTWDPTHTLLQYGASLFTGVGISDSYVTQIILGAVNTVTTLPGLWFLERFGRRKTLVYGALWQSAWL